jgi:hypothetical protein
LDVFANSTGYDHGANVAQGLITIMWSVGSNGTVKGKLAFNGLFGWLAMGLSVHFGSAGWQLQGDVGTGPGFGSEREGM